MSALVDEKFREWTEGLDVKNGMIAVFEHIRDIPYSLAVPMNDPKTAPAQILALGRGYCGPKHYLLAEMFRNLNIEVVYATFPFLWNDPDLNYPQNLRQLATGLPVVHHLACRARINNRWVLVDATWDRPLKQAGFPVNEDWDGRAETRCAVKPLRSAVRTAFCRTATNEPCCNDRERDLNPLDGEQDQGDTGKQPGYFHRTIGKRNGEDLQRIRRFHLEFDAWLEKVRRGQ